MKSPLQAFPTRRFWVAIFALVSLGVMAGGLAYYRYEQDHNRREKYQDLAAIADLKVRQIVEWRRERLDDAARMGRDPFLRKAIAAWLQDPSNPGLRTALLEQFKSEQIGRYGNVLLADLDGRILLSILPDPVPLSPAGKQALEAAVAGRQAVLSDLFRSPKDDRVHLDVAVPVLDPRGQPLAVVVLRVNADKVLYPLIQSWPTPSLTGETLLVEVEGKDMLFLNELRHREKTALSLREPLTQTELTAVQAGLGKQGGVEGRDYRGKKVLADLRPVPQSPWFMVAKVDADEILAEARYRAGITALFVVIFILLTAAVTAYGYRQRQANLYQDLYQTERERRQAQEEFQTILYSIGDAVITTDTAGLVKQVNSVAERLTGWLEAEARGKPLEEVFRIINEETRTAVENPAQRVLREGIVLGLANHTMLIARDGTEHPIADSGAPIRDENGAVIGVVLVFRDQTTERAAHKALRESEEHYRTLFDNMLNGFAYCKMLFEQNLPQDFIYLKVNQSFGELTGLKNVVGKKVSEVISGIRESDPELFEIYGRVALTGKPERFETYLEA
ncbi:MAG: PAS domain-containing protein, partial [Desulfobacterales bacterium]|nr:PAS domain-containing protein [Desulfobacterales bacterium]